MRQVLVSVLKFKKMSEKILITGGAGFIGSHFAIRAARENFEIVVLDVLNYAADLQNLAAVSDLPNFKFIRGDICDPQIAELFSAEKFDFVVNFAAETHVDFSISDPAKFARTNFLGTENLLRIARDFSIKKFVQVSTDEVYGSLDSTGKKFTENSPLRPNSPYAASKAGADLLARSFFKTFDFPVCVSRCSNNFGPHQDLSKLIPTIISRARRDEKIPIYGDGKNIRDWLFVDDHVDGIFKILQNFTPGEIYNFGGNCEKNNLEIARAVLRILNKSESLIEFVADRPGHDFRYAVDFSRAEKNLNWRPSFDFSKNLQKTVDFFAKKL